ncbi:Glycylpeptide N-tetradecanoyltransferase 2, partial [Trichinella britovi]
LIVLTALCFAISSVRKTCQLIFDCCFPKKSWKAEMDTIYNNHDKDRNNALPKENGDLKKSSGAKDPSPEQENVSVMTVPEYHVKQKLFTLLTLSDGYRTQPKSIEAARKKTFHFWDTQPVPKFEENVLSSEAVEPNKKIEDVRKEPYSLPEGFEWCNVDVDNEEQMEETYMLLQENYVEDEDNMFRFGYSLEFLKWALKPPGWQSDWHIGVRAKRSKKLIGFISAIPAMIRIYNRLICMVEINFLCVHKKLRSKRVAPVLIREVTRRVNLHGIFQAVYTAGVVLPRPVSTCRYWHRSLNPKKLIDVRFSQLGKNMTVQRTMKLYRLPKEVRTPGFRRITEADMEAAFLLLEEYLKKFDLAPVYSLEQFKYWFTPRPDVVDTYVVENDGVVTDFASFYTLPSSVMHHPVYKSIHAAYAFYNVATKTSLVDLMHDILVVAKNANYDVFNALDLMDNKVFLEKLKFGKGDGHLHYYLYNWRCPVIPPDKISYSGKGTYFSAILRTLYALSLIISIISGCAVLHCDSSKLSDIVTEIDGEVLAYVDLDRDLFFDLVVKVEPNILQFYLAKKNGSGFLLADSFTIKLFWNRNIVNVAVGNFDGDMYPDLLVTTKDIVSTNSSKVHVCFGSERHFFCDSQTYDIEDEPQLVDCDCDQKSDFLALLSNGSIACFISGRSGRQFVEQRFMVELISPVRRPFSVAFVDMTGDLIPELVLMTDTVKNGSLVGFEVWTINETSRSWVHLDGDIEPLQEPRKQLLLLSSSTKIGQPLFEDFNADGLIDMMVPVLTETDSTMMVWSDGRWSAWTLNTTDSDGVIWRLVVDLNQSSTFSLQAGDYLHSGYPALLAVLENANRQRAAFLMTNYPSQRQFRIDKRLPFYRNPSLTNAAFYDLSEDGFLDVMLLRNVSGRRSSLFILSERTLQSIFLKIQICWPLPFDSYLMSWPGSSVQLQLTTWRGTVNKYAGALMYSTAYKSLLLPYKVISTGWHRWNDNRLKVGIAAWSKATFEKHDLMPITRTYVNPYPADKPKHWKLTQIIIWSRMRIITGSILLLGTVVVLCIIIFFMEIRQWRMKMLGEEDSLIPRISIYYR